MVRRSQSCGVCVHGAVEAGGRVWNTGTAGRGTILLCDGVVSEGPGFSSGCWQKNRNILPYQTYCHGLQIIILHRKHKLGAPWRYGSELHCITFTITAKMVKMEWMYDPIPVRYRHSWHFYWATQHYYTINPAPRPGQCCRVYLPAVGAVLAAVWLLLAVCSWVSPQWTPVDGGVRTLSALIRLLT